MRFISFIVLVGILGSGGYWANKKYPHLKDTVIDFIGSGRFHTLEARFSPEQIMSLHAKELLKDKDHKFLDPVLKFYPYLFLDVKYANPENTHTGEGIILWDLIDGEKVINTRNWEKTHGFGDCIKAGIDKSEFKIINLLAQRGGALDREGISKILKIESDILDTWIESCRKKKLVVQNGNQYRLHLQMPRLYVTPETLNIDYLVTKSYKNAPRLSKKFSSSQIKKIAEAAFGPDFAIRNVTEVFLPICTITVQNPDGTLHTTYWNALNGQEISFHSLLE